MADIELPRAKKGMTCPLHRCDMSKVCHKCPLWVQVRGKDPQSEAVVDRWNCSLGLLPMLLIESSQMQRQTGAAIESLRNEVVRSNDGAVRAMARGIDMMSAEVSRAQREVVTSTIETIMTAQRAIALTDQRGEK